MSGLPQPLERSDVTPMPMDDPAFSGEEITLENEIDRILVELGDDSSESSVHVFRIVTGQPKPVFCDEYPPSEFSLKRLRDDFGGGTFRVMVYVPRYEIRNGERKKMGVQCAKNQRVDIDGKPRTPKRDEPAPESAATTAPVFDPEAFMARVLVAVKESVPQPKTLKEQLEDLKFLKDIFEPKSAPVPPRDTLKDFLQSLEIQDKLMKVLPNKGGDGGTGLGDIVGLARDFLGVIRPSIPGAQSPDVNLPGEPVLAPVEPARPPQPAAQPLPVAADMNEEERDMHLIYVGYIGRLVAKARKAEDVKNVAEQVYDMLPDEALTWILNDENYLERLTKFHKDVPTYKIWFDRLRAELIALHAEEQGKPQA